MKMQKYFEKFHEKIKSDNNSELREKRDVLVDKITAYLKKEKLPIPTVINQGSYIYGVGNKPLGDVEYDIDVGLEFPIKSSEYNADKVRQWTYDAISNHNNFKTENRGPCIRVRYAKGFHVDLVVYAKHKANENIEEHQIARKGNEWRPSEPKKLKTYIAESRKVFSETKDLSGADQLQRVTRFLKRWNDVECPSDSPDKPSGLAMLLLAIECLDEPVLSKDGLSDDMGALLRIANAVKSMIGRVEIFKPTEEFEDVFSKLDEEAMINFKGRFLELLDALESSENKSEEEAALIIKTQFGDDFPTSLSKRGDDCESDRTLVADMKAAVPKFSNPSKPWCQGG